MVHTAHFRTTTALAGLGLAGLLALPANAQQAPQIAESADNGEVEEIVVTGSYIRRVQQADRPSPIATIGREDINTIGAADIADITQTLTTSTGAQNNPDAFTQNLTAGTSNINLRGLGLSSTLVLLNGKRQVASAAPDDNGVLFVDTASLVPMIALERTEILEDGAAALYGTDAVAGVVNFITRDDFEGLELRGEWQGNTNASQNDLRVEGIWGGGNDRTHLTLSASYLDRSALTTRERDLRPEAFRGQGGLSVSTTAALPGNFIPLNAPNAALDPRQQALANVFNAFADNAAPVFDFGPAGQFASPVIPNPAGGFLVGNFSGFSLQQGAATAGAADGLADAFTASFLPQVLGLAPELLNPALAGFSTDQLSSAQQQQLGAAFQALAAAQGEQGFSPFIVPDPQCADAAALSDDIIYEPETVVDPVTGQEVAVALPGPGGSLRGSCQTDFGTQFNLVPRTTRLQGYAKLDHEFNRHARFYGEFSYARNRTQRQNSNFPISSPLTILPNNPFNPFTGSASLFLGRSPGGGQVNDFFSNQQNPGEFEHDTWRMVAGLTGDIGNSWYYDVSYLRGINNYHFTDVSDGLAVETNLALNGQAGVSCRPGLNPPGTGGCLFYNPFASGIVGPDGQVPVRNLDGTPVIGPDGNPVTAPVVNSDAIYDFITGEITLDGRSTLTVIDAVTAGELFDLPAGPVGLAVGFQYREDSLRHDLDENTNGANFLFVTAPIDDFFGERDVYSFFGELQVPILDNLELSAALRYEDYGGFIGDTVDPKIALLYQPVPDLSLRGSWGTAFRAPSVFQQFGNQTSLNSVFDPVEGGESFIAITSAGNPDLKPEESETFNLGVTYTPRQLAGLEFNVDYWNFDFDDVITQQQPEELAARTVNTPNNEIPGVVERGPTGGLNFIRTEFVNRGGIKTDGFDIGVSYTLDTDFGTFRPGFEGTYVKSYKATLEDNGPAVDIAGSRNSQNFAAPVPEWRFNASLAYVYRNHALTTFVRYIDGLRDDQNCGGGDTPADFQPVDPVTGCAGRGGFARVDSQTTVDIQYNYTFGAMGPLRGARVAVGSINLFDNDPPFVNTDGAFATRVHDPRGRMVYVRLTTTF
ncbi:TonB-dependent receptor-like protein [Rhodothalassium salexigens DSM 2132]|uniref:TonB-dependent receptor-like protein n=1 Tax=Rhodothalassium salexigens DSM 2132 TaxID=1188247 RepID=A0A4R2PB15_RHOSA|nr:TonB-dependent receptor [Rhodothalassium salexigens]MBB4212474.1 outer membrane receptor protein involved in Fe transport [Rhodothalassium salexigens DSM 2132]MBK1639536.1 hypothetical protein [Rhodothalassium salexigens DSM 2132]TCP31484.1 TonB-dependent receptor-like protein [Rhodothalassium salexigens DSM 2132]